jgi:hypothetical protein
MTAFKTGCAPDPLSAACWFSPSATPPIRAAAFHFLKQGGHAVHRVDDEALSSAIQPATTCAGSLNFTKTH